MTEVFPDGKAQAPFGIAGGFSAPVDVRVEGSVVKIVTPRKAVVELKREGDDSLVGTFTAPNGQALAIRFAKIKPLTEIDGQKQLTQPSFKEGDFWRFRVDVRMPPRVTDTAELRGDFEISVSGGQLKLLQIEGEQRFEVPPVYDGRVVNLHFIGAEFLSLLDSRQLLWEYLQFPLFVGKTWSNSYRAIFPRSCNDTVVTLNSENRVTEVAKIRAAAGTFRAFKIERNANGLGATCPLALGAPVRRFNFTYTYFYSPETRSIVRYQYRAMVGRTIELTEFGSAR